MDVHDILFVCGGKLQPWPHVQECVLTTRPQAMFNVAIGTTVTAKFYKLADTDAEPGHEYSRYAQLKTNFTLGTMVGVVLAVATAFLASLWKAAAAEVGGFMAPCLFGVFAVYVRLAPWWTCC